MITKFDQFVNEGFFSLKKEAPKRIKYDCEEVTRMDLWDRFGPSFPLSFNDDEKREISLFIGDMKLLSSRRVDVFNYEIKKDIGFGLLKDTKRRIHVKVTKEKGKNDDFHYVVTFRYPKEEIYFLCGNLNSCFRKIEEMENSENEEIEEPLRYEEPIEIDEL